jgi:hypothetical protein
LINPATGAIINSSQSFPVAITPNSPAVRHIDASPALMPWVSTLEIELVNLRYDDTFSYDSILIPRRNLQYYQSRYVYIDVKKQPGAILPPSPDAVWIQAHHDAIYVPLSLLRSFNFGQYMEIIIYDDIGRNKVLSRLIVDPALFIF